MPLLLPPPCRSFQPPGLHQRGPPRWGCIPLSLQVIHTKILIACPNQTNYAVQTPTFTCPLFILHPHMSDHANHAPPFMTHTPYGLGTPYLLPPLLSIGIPCPHLPAMVDTALAQLPAMVAAVLAPTSCGRDRARTYPPW